MQSKLDAIAAALLEQRDDQTKEAHDMSPTPATWYSRSAKRPAAIRAAVMPAPIEC